MAHTNRRLHVIVVAIRSVALKAEQGRIDLGAIAEPGLWVAAPLAQLLCLRMVVASSHIHNVPPPLEDGTPL